ncbi:MAG: 4Fe-4S dicluster domain-containing protein [Hyphomicrobiales bacterium]
MTIDPKTAPAKAGEEGVGRRDFLRAVAGFAGVALAPGVTLYAYGAEARPLDEPASGKVRWGMLVDVSRCKPDCDACVSACFKENGLSAVTREATDAQWIRKVNISDPKTGAAKSLPVMCQHCAEPPCVDVCPTGASFKRADGIVLVDKHICIGCRYCMMACPYKARSFVHEPHSDQVPHAPRGKGTVEACTMCVHRVDAGAMPACVDACATTGNGAIIFGDLNDPNSEIAQRIKTYATSQIRADLGVDPGVHYQNL